MYTQEFADVVLKAVNANDIKGMDIETFQILQKLKSVSSIKFPADISITYNSMIDKFYPQDIELRNK